jgi:hypothetical protein
MRRVLLLLPAVLLHAGCDSDPGIARPVPPPMASTSGPSSVWGTVYDATDEAYGVRRPLSDVRVTLHAWNEDFLVEPSLFAETKSQADGRYSLSFSPRGGVWLGAWKAGYGYHAVQVDSELVAPLDIELVVHR